MIEQISKLLRQCGSAATVMPPTELYNEGWMLRLVLDWFDQNRSVDHELAFLPGARWYSEALLAPAFLAEKRGDRRAESHTHADGIIGHFGIQPGERGEATALPDTRQVVIIEAKLGSALSSGVTNAPGFDQAARTVACMANMLFLAKTPPQSLERLGFYVVAPRRQIDAGIFADLVSKHSLRTKVAARVAQYNGSKDLWFEKAFEPLLACIDVGILSWESILDFVLSNDPKIGLREFYLSCLRYSPQRAKVLV
jgi:hypothetical protein